MSSAKNERAPAGTGAHDQLEPRASIKTRAAVRDKISLLQRAALALPIGGSGYVCTPTGTWFTLWRETATQARARRVTEDEVRDGLLAEARFLDAEREEARQ